MARPAPKIILENPNGNSTTQIIECEGIWAVFYKDEPFQLKLLRYNFGTIIPSYQRNFFVNPGHGYRLDDSLNIKFNTDHFKVKKLQYD